MPYLTPDNPVTSRVISIQVPDDLEPYFWGALSDLLRPEHWEEYGPMTPEEAASACMALMEEIDPMKIIAYLPEGGTAGQYLTKANDLDHTLAWVDPTLSPPGGLAYVENVFLGRQYSLWESTKALWGDEGYQLSDGFLGTLDYTQKGFIGWDNDTNLHHISFDLGEPIQVVSYVFHGLCDYGGNILPPDATGAWYSDDELSWTNALWVGHGSTPEGIYHAALVGNIPFSVGPHRYWIMGFSQTIPNIILNLSELQLRGIITLP